VIKGPMKGKLGILVADMYLKSRNREEKPE
jgi:hypothetical protein